MIFFYIIQCLVVTTKVCSQGGPQSYAQSTGRQSKGKEKKKKIVEYITHSAVHQAEERVKATFQLVGCFQCTVENCVAFLTLSLLIAH
ncbi:hypothetical protein HD806DRAFT_486088 [Xylariaceae sp. AK1471]|nr:hypothetical protein HD806DRAFT_486088 [Xylariaceae sp. AK1471]